MSAGWTEADIPRLNPGRVARMQVLLQAGAGLELLKRRRDGQYGLALRGASLLGAGRFAGEAAGAHGVIRSGSAIQVVVGPEADTIASDIEDLM